MVPSACGPSEQAKPACHAEAEAGIGADRPSPRDRHSCEKPSRPEAAITAARSRTVFPYTQPARFQFTVNHDTSLILLAAALACCRDSAVPAIIDRREGLFL
jgi:hypothetical protein